MFWIDAHDLAVLDSVTPGQSVDLTATVVAPDVAGRYTLAWDMRPSASGSRRWVPHRGTKP
jgi:hypothetical protein